MCANRLIMSVSGLWSHIFSCKIAQHFPRKGPIFPTQELVFPAKEPYIPRKTALYYLATSSRHRTLYSLQQNPIFLAKEPCISNQTCNMIRIDRLPHKLRLFED